MVKIKEQNGALSRASKFGFGVGAFGVSVVYTTNGVLQLYFYTKVLGLTPAQSGTIMFIGALSDALLDPIVGWLVSMTRSRFGRYRPYLIFGAIPMSLAFIGTFLDLGLSGQSLFTYALCSLALFRAAFQFIYMPYTSMVAVLTQDPDERSDIESWRAWFVAAGSLTISFFGLSLVSAFGQGNDARGFLIFSVFVGVVSALSFMFTGTATREVTGASPRHDISNPVKVLKLLSGNKPFWVVTIGTVLAQSAYAMILTSSVIYFEAFLGDRALVRWPLAALTAAGLVASPIWPIVSRRFGKRFAWMAGLLLEAIVLLGLYIFAPKSIGSYIGAFFLVGCGIQAGLIVQFAAAADTLDYGEWKTGERTEAVGFAIMTFGMKASLAIGSGLVGWFFALSGYTPKGVLSGPTLEGMRLTYFVVPAIGFFLAALVVSRYKLSAAEHRKIVAELNERKVAAAEGAPISEQEARQLTVKA